MPSAGYDDSWTCFWNPILILIMTHNSVSQIPSSYISCSSQFPFAVLWTSLNFAGTIFIEPHLLLRLWNTAFRHPMLLALLCFLSICFLLFQFQAHFVPFHAQTIHAVFEKYCFGCGLDLLVGHQSLVIWILIGIGSGRGLSTSKSLLFLLQTRHQHPRDNFVHQLTTSLGLRALARHKTQPIFLIWGLLSLLAASSSLAQSLPLFTDFIVLLDIPLQAFHIMLFILWILLPLMLFNFLKHILNLCCVGNAFSEIKLYCWEISCQIEFVHLIDDAERFLLLLGVPGHVHWLHALSECLHQGIRLFGFTDQLERRLAALLFAEVLLICVGRRRRATLSGCSYLIHGLVL